MIGWNILCGGNSVGREAFQVWLLAGLVCAGK